MIARRARSIAQAGARTRSKLRSWLWASPSVAVLFALLGRPTDLTAKSSFASPYTLSQTYNAALRLVRVDLGLTITERDPAVAYILFDYRSPETGQRVVRGSIEMLDSGRSVKVIVQLAQMPRYHEQVISDNLVKKLRDEYGEPSTRKPDPPDGGSEGTPPAGE